MFTICGKSMLCNWIRIQAYDIEIREFKTFQNTRKRSSTPKNRLHYSNVLIIILCSTKVGVPYQAPEVSSTQLLSENRCVIRTTFTKLLDWSFIDDRSLSEILLTTCNNKVLGNWIQNRNHFTHRVMFEITIDYR